jgi:hypothetical protein
MLVLERKADPGNVFDLVLSHDQEAEGIAPSMNAAQSKSSRARDLLLTHPM